MKDKFFRSVGYFLVLFFLLCSVGLHAQLGEFKKNAKKEQEENKKEKQQQKNTATENSKQTDTKKTDSSWSSSNSEKTRAANDDDDDSDDLAGAIFGFILKLWVYFHANVYYTDYPYQQELTPWSLFVDPDGDQKKKIENPAEEKRPYVIEETSNQEMSDEAEPKSVKDQMRRYYLMPYLQYHYLSEKSSGISTGLTARLSPIGLHFDIQYFKENNVHLWQNRWLLILPVIQSAGFHLEFNMGTSSFNQIIEGSSFSYSFSGRIFLTRPIVISGHWGSDSFEFIRFRHFKATIGFLSQRSELYLGYEGLESESAKLYSWIAGLKFWL